MKIAYFTDTFYPEINGVTNTLKHLSEYLNEKGIENIFFAPKYETKSKQGIKSRVIRFNSIKSSLYPECRLSFPLYSLQKDKIDAFCPDLIHITTPLGIGHLGLKYAKENNIPIVMSYHTNFDKYLNFYNIEYIENLLNMYIKWFYSKADVILCPSTNTINSLKQLGFENLGLWSRGIDNNAFSPHFKNNNLKNRLGKNDKLLFLYVGRMAAEKEIGTLLESIKIVNKCMPNAAQFIFTGDGPYMDEIKKSNIPNITLTGVKKGKELSEIYASCDAFVFPSGTETFGNVLLEAMASGLPSICVNSGGVLDFAKNKFNSLICNYKEPKSMADAIIMLIKNEHLRKTLSNGALLTASQRSWNGIFNELIQNYRKVILKTKKAAV